MRQCFRISSQFFYLLSYQVYVELHERVLSKWVVSYLMSFWGFSFSVETSIALMQTLNILVLSRAWQKIFVIDIDHMAFYIEYLFWL